MALITIVKLNDVALAQVVRMKFESEGIPVHLGSEGFAGLFGVQSSFGAVQVQVPERFEAQARTVYHALMATIGEEDSG